MGHIFAEEAHFWLYQQTYIANKKVEYSVRPVCFRFHIWLRVLGNTLSLISCSQ